MTKVRLIANRIKALSARGCTLAGASAEYLRAAEHSTAQTIGALPAADLTDREKACDVGAFRIGRDPHTTIAGVVVYLDLDQIVPNINSFANHKLDKKRRLEAALGMG